MDSSHTVICPSPSSWPRVMIRRVRLAGLTPLVLGPLMIGAACHWGISTSAAQQVGAPEPPRAPFMGADVVPSEAPQGDDPELQPPLVRPAPLPSATSSAQEKSPPVRTMKLVGLLDREVLGPGDEQVGRVIDILLDPSAHPAALVVDAGGFMGVGNRRIAIAWDMIVPGSFEDRNSLRVRMSADQIRAAPAYDQDRTDVSVVLSPPPSPAVNKDEPLGASTVVPAVRSAPSVQANPGTATSPDTGAAPGASGGSDDRGTQATPPSMPDAPAMQSAGGTAAGASSPASRSTEEPRQNPLSTRHPFSQSQTPPLLSETRGKR